MTILSHLLPSSGHTSDRTPRYVSASEMLTVSMAWCASSASFPGDGKLVTSTISPMVFIVLSKWSTWTLPFLEMEM